MEILLTPSQKKLYDLQSSRRSTKINFNRIQLQVLQNCTPNYSPGSSQLMTDERDQNNKQNSEHLMDVQASLTHSKEERDFLGYSPSDEGSKKRDYHHLQTQEPSPVKRFSPLCTDTEENKDTEWTKLDIGDTKKKASNQQGKNCTQEQNESELRWRCELCTFLNKTTDNKCFLCLCSVIPSSEKEFITTSKALLENAEASNERVVNPWLCEYCTHMNMWKRDICNLCSTPRES